MAGSDLSEGSSTQNVQDSNKSLKEKCSLLAKKQRAKFYIVRRCIMMLVCWHERNDTWGGIKEAKEETKG